MSEDYKLDPKPLPLHIESSNGGNRPNLVIFMPDQLRFDSLGCTTPSDHPIKTPHIDAFARRGTLFTNCFTQASVCSQSKEMPSIIPLPEKKSRYEPRHMSNIRERYGTGRATPEVWGEIKATYYGMISRLDDQFGRLIASLDEAGLWKDTITMFFTDHGEYLGDHGLIEKWPSGLSDTLVHEPLIISGGGLPEGQVSTVMSEMVDLIPTVFELCGIGEHFPHNGKSLIPVLIKGEKTHKKYAFSEGGFLTSEEPLLEQSPYPYDIKSALQHEDTTLVGKAVSIRGEMWTYIHRLYEPPELYHRQNDPYEMHNLAGRAELQDVVEAFQAEILQWMMQSSDFLPWKQDDRFPKVELATPREQYEERLRESHSDISGATGV